MKFSLYVFVTLCLVTLTISSQNVSNILRLSKPQKVPPIRVNTPSYNITDDFSDEDDDANSDGDDDNNNNNTNSGRSENTKLHRRLVEFSKNNPELDWKNDLKKVADKIEEQTPRDLDVDFMKEKLVKTANSIQWLADLYDPLRWTRVPGKLSEDCRKDMEWFLKSLRDGELWAARMSDASGRYSSQFHFGNGFWLGSSTLCRELNDKDGKNVQGVTHVTDELPPYFVKFHVARMYLDLPKDVELSSRQVFLGLCLPESCDQASLTSILRASADRVELEGNSTHRSSGPKIHIVTVKPVPSSDYSAWLDPKLYVLTGVAGTILLLMICSTIYEYRTVECIKDIESLSASNNNERISTCADRNMPEEGKISIVQDNRFGLRCLLAFSPIINGTKILSTDPATRDSLTCLHGLRVLSLGWVVMVHTYLQVFSIAENKTLRTVTERDIMFQTISNATFSVDTFFFISGLLVTILFYRPLGSIKSEKNNFLRSSTIKFVVMILYRFVRLTPAYLFVLGMNEIAIKQTLARTVFSPAIIDHLTCEKFWWRNALYINSLYPRTEMCMLWSWYMANDTQFYVLGIFLLLLSVKYFKTVIVMILLLITSSWLTTFSIAYTNDYLARLQEPFALFDELYDKPWLRAGPYFIGTITGYVLYKTNCKLYTPLPLKLIGWVLSTTLMLSVVYGLYPDNLTILLSSTYAALAHTAWAMAVAFIVIQCCTGAAPIVDGILSLRLIYPLSRLTYCAYLVHPVIMMVTSTQMDGPLHLHNGLVLILYFGNLVASYLMSFCVSMAFEAPVVNLLKIAFTSKKRRR